MDNAAKISGSKEAIRFGECITNVREQFIFYQQRAMAVLNKTSPGSYQGQWCGGVEPNSCGQTNALSTRFQ